MSEAYNTAMFEATYVNISDLRRSLLTPEEQLQAFNKFTRTIPGQEPLTWNEALWENMHRPRVPQPVYDEPLLVGYDGLADSAI